MCARYSLTKRRLAEVADALDAEFSPLHDNLYRPRYNAAPTAQGWILERRERHRILVPATWNYAVAGGRPLINLRGEQVTTRAAFRDRRCLVVTDGFYEWPGKGLAPFRFHRPDGGLVLLGGLSQPAASATSYPRFTVLTTEPNGVVGAVHDRMPVVVPASSVDDWLGPDGARAARLIGPAPDDVLVATPVSKHVNSVKNDDPACVEPVGMDLPSPSLPQRSP